MGLFKQAVKHESKLRLAITGPSGSGKTYTALAVATELAEGKPIAVVDTEHGSASKYADVFTFDVIDMEPPYHPDRFVQFIAEAAKEGYGVVVLDSLTHAWQGTGGMLEVIDEIAKRMRNPNSFAAWKEGTPIQNRLIEAIVHSPIHIIATMRSKQEYVLQADDRGKQTPKKVGMAAQQRDGFEYEFDIVVDMDIDHNGIVSKSRASVVADRVFHKPGAEFAKLLKGWLKGAPAPAVTNGNGTNGNGHSEVEPWRNWTKPDELFTFAVEHDAYATLDDARIAFANFLKDKNLRYSTANLPAVHEAWYTHVMVLHQQMLDREELLWQQAEAAADQFPTSTIRYEA